MTDGMQPVVIDTRPIIDELSARINAQINDAIKALETKASVGWVTPDGGAADPQIKSLGDFVVAIARDDKIRLERIYKATKALNEQTGAAGGYLVPREFTAQLMQAAQEYDVFAQLAGNGPLRLPMTARQLEVPLPDYSVTPTTGATSMAAGAVTYWTSEATTVTETDFRTRLVTLTANALSAYISASNELVADNAVGLETLLTRAFATAYAARKLHAFLRGTGVGQPRGVIGHAATIGVTRGTAAAVYEAEDLFGMLRRLIPGSERRAVWFAHPYARQDLATVKVASGDAFAWGDVRAGLPDQLLGRPVYWVEFMSAPGSAGDLLLGDWTYYLFGERQELTISMSREVRFLTRETVWLVEARLDGQPMLNAPITLSDGAGSNTVSAFVQLN